MPCTYVGSTVQMRQNNCLGGLIPSAVKFGCPGQVSALGKSTALGHGSVLHGGDLFGTEVMPV